MASALKPDRRSNTRTVWESIICIYSHIIKFEIWTIANNTFKKFSIFRLKLSLNFHLGKP